MPIIDGTWMRIEEYFGNQFRRFIGSRCRTAVYSYTVIVKCVSEQHSPQIMSQRKVLRQLPLCITLQLTILQTGSPLGLHSKQLFS